MELGLAEKLGLGDGELAVMIASHNGTEKHVRTVASLLGRGGFGEDDLRCGPHSPFDRQTGLEIARRGEKPRRIHNNCSGKHSGFLHLAAALGVSPEEYLEPESASQVRLTLTLKPSERVITLRLSANDDQVHPRSRSGHHVESSHCV